MTRLSQASSRSSVTKTNAKKIFQTCCKMSMYLEGKKMKQNLGEGNSNCPRLFDL